MEIAIRRIKELQLVTLGCVVVLHQVTEIVIQPLLVSGVPDPFLENGILPVLVAPQSFWSMPPYEYKNNTTDQVRSGRSHIRL